MSIFEQATRQAIRFPSTKGELTTEQLWDLPLQSKHGFDLDSVAKMVNRDLKATSEESFVETASAGSTILQLKMDVVKHIISVKLSENAAARNAVVRKAEIERLQQILDGKKHEELQGMSVEDLQKRIDELSK